MDGAVNGKARPRRKTRGAGSEVAEAGRQPSLVLPKTRGTQSRGLAPGGEGSAVCDHPHRRADRVRALRRDPR